MNGEPPAPSGAEVENWPAWMMCSSLRIHPRAISFDLSWARHVIGQAVERVKGECEKSNRADVWGVFQARVLGPTLHENEAPSYAELVERFGFKSPTHASNVLVTGKRMFIRTIRDVVAEYGGSNEEIEEEIRDLHRVLAGGKPT